MLLERLKKEWFLVGIVVAIIAAYQNPWFGSKSGPLYPQITIKYLAVSIIFFNSGLSLRTDDLRAVLFHYKLHLFIQCFTFVFVPFVVYFLSSALHETSINENLIRGLTVVSCMPPPVSSAVIITKSIGGNEAGAIFNSALGSFLGIFLTPVLLLALVGVSGAVPVMNIVQTLCVTVVMPLVCGQLVRSRVRDWLERTKPPLGQVGSFMLLMIIYTTFCDTFSRQITGVSPQQIVFVATFIVAMQLSFMFFIFKTSVRLGFTKHDVIALMFCATHKSLTLGMPILKIIYTGDPILPFISIPLLVYHPSQILIGGLLVPTMKKWLAHSNLNV